MFVEENSAGIELDADVVSVDGLRSISTTVKFGGTDNADGD